MITIKIVRYEEIAAKALKFLYHAVDVVGNDGLFAIWFAFILLFIFLVHVFKIDDRLIVDGLRQMSAVFHIKFRILPNFDAKIPVTNIWDIPVIYQPNTCLIDRVANVLNVCIKFQCF